MRMSVREVAAMLALDEAQVHRWAEDGSLPAVLVDEQFRFNPAEVMQWAAERNRPIVTGGAAAGGLADALEWGGVHAAVPGGSLAELLANATALAPLPEGMDRGLLLEVLAAREREGATGIGDGIAVPHVRYPIVGRVAEPWVRLCFAAHPLEAATPDGRALSAVFLTISPSVRSHLQVLGRLSACLQHRPFREAVMAQAPAERILQACREAESDRA